MDIGPIQKLLLTQEYEDIEDIVMVESVFVELDKRGDGLQIVSLAITPDRLILGRYHVINYHDDPELVYDGDKDLFTEGLEIKWLAPLNYINISQIPNENILKITPRQSRARHFELCTSDPVHSKRVWNKWNNRLGYVTDDPYGYIRRESLRVDEGEVVAEGVKVQSDSDSSSDESERATETMGKPTKQKKKNQDQLPDVKPNQDQMLYVKLSQDQLLDVKPNQDQLLYVKLSQDQLLDVKPSRDQLPNVKPDAAKDTKKKKMKKKRKWFTRKK